MSHNKIKLSKYVYLKYYNFKKKLGDLKKYTFRSRIALAHNFSVRNTNASAQRNWTMKIIFAILPKKKIQFLPTYRLLQF